MDAKSLKILKTGDQIKWNRGMRNAGAHATFIAVHPSPNSDPTMVMIEFEFAGEQRIVPHDRFTKVS